jgi:ATP-dependent helicase/nuclease subunit A
MSDEVVFSDAATRAAITERLDETLFVEAGAGTGKTTALVGRVLELVRTERTTIGKIAAITFTEAAAADLRSRIHLELTEASRTPDGAWARRALGDLDDASMTTIHGFAQRILAEHPLAAGLPLRFRVSDEIEYDLAVERRFREVVEGLVADDERGQLLVGALEIGISIGTLSELAAEVDSKWDRFVDLAQEAISVESVARGIDAAEAELASAIASVVPLRLECDDEADGLAVQLEKLEAALDRRATSDDWIDRLAWCCRFRKVNHARGTKTAWTRRPIAEVRDAVGEVEALRNAIVKRISGHLLCSLVGVFAQESIAAARERRSAGELSFHDLLVFAHELLISNPEVRRQVSERYSHILVDEFQDTDPLQLKIVTDIARRADGDALVPGKLFFVGDPRQSIYRFRGAEPELYERSLDRLVPAGPLVLTSNFRSVPPILSWVNAVFERLFADEVGAASRYQGLSGVRDDKASGTVTICGVEAEERLSAHDRRVREAGDLAELVDRCVRESWPVEDKDGSRPARYGDIAILVTRRSGLAELEAALDERNIPFRADSPSLILRSAEVRDFLACLRAIDSPGDETALVGALRTPLLGCGDDDLWRYRHGGGRWRLDGAGSDGESPVADALFRLRTLADRRHVLGLLGTVQAAATELRVFELAATTRHGDEALRRLFYLFARASAFVDAGGASVASFVEWIERQSGARVRGVEAAVADDDGAVRILTVHAAKGLEFPIVLLAELAADPARQRAAGFILFDAEGRPEVHIRNGVESAGYATLYDDEKQRADDELVRILYVAMTRARDHLAVSLHRSAFVSKSIPSLADRLGALLGDLEGTYDVADFADEPPAPRETIAPPLGGPAATKAEFATWRAARDTLCRTTSLPISVGARALEGGDARVVCREAWSFEDGDAQPDSDRWKIPRGATAIGRAVHGVLQRVGLLDGRGLADLVISESARAGCNDAHSTVRTLVEAALASDELRAAARAERCWRELPISVPVANGVLDGVIDLAYEKDDRLVVVDYKTDTLRDEDALRRRFDSYRTQAGAYAFALGQVLGRPVERFTFLFLNAPQGVRALIVDDLGAAIREATAAAERYLLTPLR